MTKYIWNFYGMDGKGTAAHHRIHLEGFAATNKIPIDKYKTGLLDIDPSHSQCFMEVDKQFAELVEILRPHQKEDYK